MLNVIRIVFAFEIQIILLVLCFKFIQDFWSHFDFHIVKFMINFFSFFIDYLLHFNIFANINFFDGITENSVINKTHERF